MPSSPSSSANSTLSPSTQRDSSQSPAQNRQQQNQHDLADFKVKKVLKKIFKNLIVLAKTTLVSY